jgi:hypothetical protein
LFYPLGDVNDYKLMQMKDAADKFVSYCAWGSCIFLGLVILFGACSCKLTRDVSKNSTDSSSVKTDETKYSKSDSSKSTKEADRITFVYPVDTTVNNYYTYPSTVIYEKIKEDNTSSGSENYQNKKTDTVYVSTDNKQVESKAGTDPLTIGLIVFGGILALGIIKKLGIL